MRLSICPQCGTRYRDSLRLCPLDGSLLSMPEDTITGRTIAGRYLVGERIGSGGMGAVYRGRHQVIDRDVAIKFLHPRLTKDPTQRKRFLGEARAANQINHEHIIDITDFGETEDGLIYLVMEYLNGHSLAQEVDGQAIPAARALRIAMQVAAGLGRAHELDVIHRDVKPANVFLLRRGGDPDFVKLLDFGIARFERETRITDRGAVVGTPEYIAPELLRYGEVGPASDLYSLGCVLFEMLTGRPPFAGAPSVVMVQQMTKPPPKVSSLVPGLPIEFDAVIFKILSKAPHERHRDAYHLCDELAQLLALLPSETPGVQRSRPTGESSVRPTIHVPVAEEGWEQRLHEYRQQAERKFGKEDLPAGLLATIENAQLVLGEIRALRNELTNHARTLTDQEDGVRAVRMRVCHALDELARDESKLTRDLESDRGEIVEIEKQLLSAVAAVGRSVASIHGPPTAREALSEPAARELTALLEAARALARTQTRRDQLEARIDKRRGDLEDLRFQIAQLKGRLGSLNAASSVEMSESQMRTHHLDAEIRDKLDNLVDMAEHINSQLKTRVPTPAPS